jgi:hypothetical protein
MQSIEEIVAEAVEKKRIQDAEHERKCQECADAFIASLQPAIAQCLVDRSNHPSWIWFDFKLPTGEKFQAEVNLYYSESKGVQWRPYVFNPIMGWMEYGRRYQSYSEVIAQAIDANNLKNFLASKEIKI